MRIAVLAEAPGERRVSITPSVTSRLIAAGHEVVVEPGAGVPTGFSDSDYEAGGAMVKGEAASEADVTIVVGPPSKDQAERVPSGRVLVGLLDPFNSVDLLKSLQDREITSFAMESVPRTTLAQTMDVLSSQATAAGYHAVLMAATATPRFFPMLTTAAGTFPPVKVLVLGAGVAGLQAIATAKRLGALVSAYDIRPEVQEQIESLGAKFVAAPVDESAAAATGYAKEVSDETQRRQQEALARVVADSDVLITTAQIPGRPAPLLVSREMIEGMSPGSVIVDVAASTGGNCELTRPGANVEHNGVLIMGPDDLASRVAVDASEMYARNIAAFLGRLADEDGAITIDLEDEILSEANITHDGRVTHPTVRRAHGLDGGT